MLKLINIPLFVVFGILWSGQSQEDLVDARDGRKYKTLQIGTQTWMAENLAYLPNGSSDKISITGIYVYKSNEEDSTDFISKENFEKYGCLYDWNTAKKICPTGWHLPSDEEWKTLEAFYGMNTVVLNAFGLRFSGNVANQLKSTSNETAGFTSLTGGFRTVYQKKIRYRDDGKKAYYWTSSSEGNRAYGRMIDNAYNAVDRSTADYSEARSVRCVKN